MLDLKRLGYPEALLGIKSLSAVYVADVRYNRWESIPPDVVGLSGLVVLNASDNNIRMVADGKDQTHVSPPGRNFATCQARRLSVPTLFAHVILLVSRYLKAAHVQ